MKFDEIIEKLKTIFDNVDDFAFEDIPYGEIEKSERVLAAEKKQKEWNNKNPQPLRNTPEYNDWCLKYKKEYLKLEHPYDLWRDDWFNHIGLKWKEVHQQGGEGEGDHWESVKYFPEHNMHIKVVGYYQSYDGVSFEDGWGCCSEVRPKKKTITIYE